METNKLKTKKEIKQEMKARQEVAGNKFFYDLFGFVKDNVEEFIEYREKGDTHE